MRYKTHVFFAIKHLGVSGNTQILLFFYRTLLRFMFFPYLCDVINVILEDYE